MDKHLKNSSKYSQSSIFEFIINRQYSWSRLKRPSYDIGGQEIKIQNSLSICSQILSRFETLIVNKQFLETIKQMLWRIQFHRVNICVFLVNLEIKIDFPIKRRIDFLYKYKSILSISIKIVRKSLVIILILI